MVLTVASANGPAARLVTILLGLGAVARIFTLSLFTLWFLKTKIGLRLTANVAGEAYD